MKRTLFIFYLIYTTHVGMDPCDIIALSGLEIFFLHGDDKLIKYFFSFVGVEDILKVMQTSKTMEKLCRIYIRFEWDVRRCLRPWFVDVDGFRRKLERCNAVISGSQALQFFDRDHYPGSDMDLYVRSSSAEDLGRWLLRDGYRYRSRSHLYSHGRFRRDSAKLAVCCIENPRRSGSMRAVFNFIR